MHILIDFVKYFILNDLLKRTNSYVVHLSYFVLFDIIQRQLFKIGGIMEYTIVEATRWCQSSFFDSFFQIITWFGDEVFFLLSFTLIYWLYKREYALKFGLFYLISTGVNGFLKVVVGRTRPNGGTGSFPSGHSQSFGMQASMIGVEVFQNKNMRLRNKIFIFIELFVAWFMIAYSRLYLNFHFLSDVIAGLLIAFILALLLNLLWGYVPTKWKTSQIKNILMYIIMGGALLLYIIFSVTNKMISSTTWLTIYNFTGSIIGVCIGDILNDKFIKYNPSEDNSSGKILKVILGVSILALFYYFIVLELGEKLVYLMPLYYAIMMFMATFVLPLIFKKWNFEEKRINQMHNDNEE